MHRDGDTLRSRTRTADQPELGLADSTPAKQDEAMENEEEDEELARDPSILGGSLSLEQARRGVMLRKGNSMTFGQLEAG